YSANWLDYFWNTCIQLDSLFHLVQAAVSTDSEKAGAGSIPEHPQLGRPGEERGYTHRVLNYSWQY
ncbi:hypothetical protein GBAR_LOCUS14078, partial [Geodia barretti]